MSVVTVPMLLCEPFTMHLDAAITENDRDVTLGRAVSGWELDVYEEADRAITRRIDEAVDLYAFYGHAYPDDYTHETALNDLARARASAGANPFQLEG